MSENRALRGIRLIALFGAGALIVAACSSAATPTPSATATSPAATSGATPSGGTGTSSTVNVANKAGIGNYLTGRDGKTLYVKKGDSTSASTCTGTCLANWPPFALDTGESVAAGSGVTGTLSTYTRSDTSAMQVTYKGAPLYYFKGDSAAGDTNGQGIAGVWSAAVP